MSFRALLRQAATPESDAPPNLEERVRREIEAAEERRAQPPPPVDTVVGRGLAEAVNMLTRIVFRRSRPGGGR